MPPRTTARAATIIIMALYIIGLYRFESQYQGLDPMSLDFFDGEFKTLEMCDIAAFGDPAQE